MSQRYELKPLGSRDLNRALQIAVHFRNLNQPEEAESVCRDVLAVTPEDPEALRLFGLSLTDQFPTEWARHFEEAVRAFKKLPDEYERFYYVGIAWESLARAHRMHKQMHNAAHAYEEALRCFHKAEELGSPGAPEPLLMWNRCVRALAEDEELGRALEAPTSRVDLGD